jgi:hypothetical protein
MSLVYLVWLTPMTNMGASAEGAEMMTFLAPPFRWAEAFSIDGEDAGGLADVVGVGRGPRDLVGLRSAKTATSLPLTMKPSGHSSSEHSTALYFASPTKRPWT